MTDAEIWALTYGIEDIPADQRGAFMEHMLNARMHNPRKCTKAVGQVRYFQNDVREFFAKIGQECPPPGRRKREARTYSLEELKKALRRRESLRRLSHRLDPKARSKPR